MLDALQRPLRMLLASGGVLGLFWITACSDSHTSLHPLDTSEVERSITSADGPPDFRPGLEAEFGRLALQFSGFAGYALDRNGLVVRLTNPQK